MWFQLVQLDYWLGLSTWFGCVLFIALAAPVIFKTVRENNPILTDVLSVNMEGQHGTLLAGSIVVNLIQRLLRVQIICAGMVLAALIAQPFVIDISTGNLGMAILRSVLFVAAGAVVFFDRQVVWPKIQKNRDQYITHADEPEIANPAKDRFDQEQRQSLILLIVVVALLLGMILFSTTITPPQAFMLVTKTK